MSKQFAIFHISKAKPSSGGLHAHIERKHVPHNADASMTKNNLYLHDEQLHKTKAYQKQIESGEIKPIQERINERISEGYTSKRKIRSNTIRELDIMLTGSHESLCEIAKDKNKLGEWMKSNYEFVASEFGEKNIVSFALHLDEATPHIHVTVVPLTKDGRLSTKELLNGTDREAPKGEHLRKMQDRYGEKMKPFGLERGISSKETQVKHTTTKEYYREVEAAKQKLEPLKRTSLNFTKVKQQAMHVLASGATEMKKQESSKTKSINRAVADVRESANLIGLAMQHGYKIDRLKSCRSSVQMRNGEEKIVVSMSEKKGHWMYFKMGTEEKGNAVDFLRNHGKQWSEIVNMSTFSVLSDTIQSGHAEYEKLPETIRDVQAAHEEAVSRFPEQTHLKPFNASRIDYLSRERSIDHSIIQSCSESFICGGSYAQFKTFLPDQTGEWLHTGSIRYSGSSPSKKQFTKGLPKGWAVVSAGERDKRLLIVCESPIDGLSYAELKGVKDFTILASCGRPSKEQMAALKKVAEKKNEKVILADFDPAGKQLSEQFLQVLGASAKIEWPKGQIKDFNEQLIEKKRSQNLGQKQGLSI